MRLRYHLRRVQASGGGLEYYNLGTGEDSMFEPPEGLDLPWEHAAAAAAARREQAALTREVEELREELARAGTGAGGQCRPRYLRTAPRLPAWWLQGLRPLLRNPERSLSILKACRGSSSPAQAAPKKRALPLSTTRHGGGQGGAAGEGG
jgi:hypothetical protein